MCLLGLSYGAVSLVLDALGIYLRKNTVCLVVQAAAKHMEQIQWAQVFEPTGNAERRMAKAELGAGHEL